MRAELISVGTELLLGDIVNTNAQYISKELAALGIGVFHQSTVGDNPQRLLECFDEALKRSDIVITTGGLGPTKDDLTKEMAAEYFGQEMVLHEESWEYIQDRCRKFAPDKPIPENNKKQAMFPVEATVLKNNNGTAPGAIFEKDGKRIIVLPGPPWEMKAMFDESVRPFLQQFTDSILVSRVLRFNGIGESALELEIEDILDNQTNPTVALYAKEMEVIIRITAKAKDDEEAKVLLDEKVAEIRDRVGKYIYAEGGDEMVDGDSRIEETVAKMLVEKGLTIATAESCTGGLVAGTLINYPGISDVFLEGCVTYSNAAKVKRLGVSEETLEKYGAVSPQTATEMAEGIRKGLGANIGLSTTGVAGPGGGTEEKQVGLVYTAISINGETKVRKNNFRGDRQKVRRRAVRQILIDLKTILDEM